MPNHSRPLRIAIGSLLVVAAALIGQPEAVLGATAAQQKTALRRATTYHRSAKRLLSAERIDEAAEMYKKAKAAYDEAAEGEPDPRNARYFERTAELLRELQKGLVEAGASGVPKPPAFDAGSFGPSKPSSRGEQAGRFDPNNVSFVRDVAPMLAAKCGRCHIDRRQGGFSLASYSDLVRGVAGQAVLVPGDGAASLITELIVSGDMPRGGGRVSPQETQKLMTWITQGAKFDGDNPRANLRQLKPKGEEPDAPAMQAGPKVARPTGNETVSFALDVAPILTANCTECHGTGRARAGLNMASMAALLQGGDSGAAIAAGQPNASGLVRRLLGEDQPRMPLNRPPLSEKEIETISTWVREGAKFDGENPSDRLPRVTALVRADRATPDELTAMREDLAERTWRLALPDETADAAPTDRFHVVGNVPPARLQEVGADAERISEQLLKLFDHPQGQPLAKGRVTLFALEKRIDLSEFGLMVLRRELPRSQRGVASHDAVDAYAAVLFGATPSEDDTAALTRHLTSVYLSERTTGRLDDWLQDGAARAAALRLAPDAPLVAAWRDGLATEAARIDDPKLMLNGKLSPERAGVLRMGLVEVFMKQRKLGRILTEVADGKTTEAAVRNVYKLPPEELAARWLSSLRRRR
ncbi:MAG: c-type cytochrome domain-containing protein [Planctomycetota bacterium]